MKERRSVRTYSGEPLTAAEIRDLLRDIDQAYNPFGGNFTIRLRQYDMAEGFKPSTYGMIRGARDFFLMGVDADPRSALALGFTFEQVVLDAWIMGLGTCWIAATFKGTDFDRDQEWPAGQTLRIISPVGTPAKKSVKESLTRLALGSKNRKPFGQLFFRGDASKPLETEGRFAEALEMLRLAPSSTNSQPWRAIVDGDKVHFFYIAKSPASVLDCGIGLSHFYLTEKHYGHAGTFQRLESAPAGAKDWHYLITYTA